MKIYSALMIDISFNCFEGSNFDKLKFWCCFCCRSSPDEEIIHNKKARKSEMKTIKKRIIVFNKLPANIDFKNLFDTETTNATINIVFNLENFIICAHSENISKIFQCKVDNLIGLNLKDLQTYIPRSILKMFSDILSRVKISRKQNGCVIEIDGEPYICCGFPVITNVDGHLEVVSIMLIKQPLDESLLNHLNMLESKAESEDQLS